MQHRELLEMVENDMGSMDRNHLKRVCLLLLSDLWSVGAWLDDRERMEADRIVALEAERDRINGAIDKIRKRTQELSEVV